MVGARHYFGSAAGGSSLMSSGLAWHTPLLLVAFLPFPTAVLGHAFDNPLAVCLFAVSEAAVLGSEAGLKEAAHRAPILAEGTDSRQMRQSASASWAVAGFFLVTAALAWPVPYLPFIWLAAPLAAHFGGRLVEACRRG